MKRNATKPDKDSIEYEVLRLRRESEKRFAKSKFLNPGGQQDTIGMMIGSGGSGGVGFQKKSPGMVTPWYAQAANIHREEAKRVEEEREVLEPAAPTPEEEYNALLKQYAEKQQRKREREEQRKRDASSSVLQLEKDISELCDREKRLKREVKKLSREITTIERVREEFLLEM
eukprot:NODE_4609_length_786_cov_22.641791_g4266_i0.p1 GENE.NODE_4609_length_786_cov_22.641791_g4266_i0~~NODE_4609_length_786_cov_22.641791_g4266_i0.p1  ORF type:complete len:173 (+),score=53.70 NODE_4609_length_786_cov_22.641791_g4266_i0:158-676(+)